MPLKIRGKVTYTNGAPAEKVTVEAMHRGLKRDDMSLGSRATDKDGHYNFDCDLSNIGVWQARGPNVFVRIQRDGRILATSSVVYRASVEAVIDISVPNATSEFRRSSGILDPLFAELEGAQPSSVDLRRLSLATGLDLAEITAFANAKHSKEATGLDAMAHFYALYRTGNGTTPLSLLSSNPDLLERALDQARGAGIVSAAEVRLTAKDFLEGLRAALRSTPKEPLGDLGELLGVV